MKQTLKWLIVPITVPLVIVYFLLKWKEISQILNEIETDYKSYP